MKTENAVKHTPGPWRVGDACNTVFGPKTDAICPEIVASIRGGRSDQAAVSRALIMKANATLISAAPDLLDAARGMLWAWNNPLGTKGTDVYANELQKAIDKAEGRI